MSLRKSTCLTPQRLAAARGNSLHSTGPRSAAGKQRMRMNALKHGCDAAPENERAVMRALGEDPEEYEALQRELATTYGPGDALWDRQPGDLARLYWRRNLPSASQRKINESPDGIGRAPRGINDGKGFVFVSHRGDAYPSGFLPLRAGSVPS